MFTYEWHFAIKSAKMHKTAGDFVQGFVLGICDRFLQNIGTKICAGMVSGAYLYPDSVGSDMLIFNIM